MAKNWEILLENYPNVVEEVHGVLIVAKLLGYKIKYRLMDDKGNSGICFDFNKGRKELHLDIFFNQDKSLKEICTCRGNCQSYCSSLLDGNFINPINAFKKIL